MYEKETCRFVPITGKARSVANVDVNDRAVGRRLSAARRAAGMQTRKELTDAAGLRRVSAGTLGKIERGERPLEPHEAEAFARALNIDARTFYDDPADNQLDRIEQALVDLGAREDEAAQARDGILELLAQQSRILADISALLARQDQILADIQRVVAGMPEDETLRLLQEAVRLIPDGTLPSSEGRAGQSADRAAGRRRRAGN